MPRRPQAVRPTPAAGGFDGPIGFNFRLSEIPRNGKPDGPIDVWWPNQTFPVTMTNDNGVSMDVGRAPGFTSQRISDAQGVPEDDVRLNGAFAPDTAQDSAILLFALEPGTWRNWQGHHHWSDTRSIYYQFWDGFDLSSLPGGTLIHASTDPKPTYTAAQVGDANENSPTIADWTATYDSRFFDFTITSQVGPLTTGLAMVVNPITVGAFDFLDHVRFQRVA